VQTDAPCEVAVLGRTASTFTVAGHHYALVVLDGLAAGSTLPYEVHLDGVACWPPPDDRYTPCVIRTHSHDASLRLAFGSCRVSVPHAKPYVLSKDEDPRGREVDALLALVERMRHEPCSEWPDAFVLLGDQVYADEVSPQTGKLIASRRGAGGPPPDEVADFEEYTSLYCESWSDPALRWLLSTVSSAMIFDDHDVHDDWNISEAWVAKMRAEPWWEERILGAYMSYWIYQHLGNLSPARLYDDPIFCAVQAAEGDCADLVRDFARTAAREIAGARWSFHRDFGRTRLVVVDSRAGRVLSAGRRQMLSDHEWEWVEDRCSGDFDHLIVGTSLPVMARRRDAPPRGLERGRLRRRLGAACGAPRREGPPGPRPRALGGVRALLQPPVGAARERRGRSSRARSGDDHAVVGRRAPRLRRRGLVSRPRRQQPGAAGDVLADPQPARQARAPGAAGGVHPAGGRVRPRAGACRRCVAAADALGVREEAHLRQPDRAAGPARARGAAVDREDRARGLAGAPPAPDRVAARDAEGAPARGRRPRRRSRPRDSLDRVVGVRPVNQEENGAVIILVLLVVLVVVVLDGGLVAEAAMALAGALMVVVAIRRRRRVSRS
jgi:hypothetical protein